VPTETHLALQQYYAGDDGLVEEEVDGYRADVLRDGVVYEIQTGSFSAIRDKLDKLSKTREVILVHPIPETKIIVRVDPESRDELSARRSPKRGAVSDVFRQLVYIAKLLRRQNLSLEVLLTAERELRQDDGRGSWHRKGVSIVGRELMEIVETHRFDRPADFLRLLPDDLPNRFTVADLVAATGMRKRLAGKVAYALREMGTIAQVGKKGSAYLYERAATGAHRTGRAR